MIILKLLSLNGFPLTIIFFTRFSIKYMKKVQENQQLKHNKACDITIAIVFCFTSVIELCPVCHSVDGKKISVIHGNFITRYVDEHLQNRERPVA